MDRSWGETLTGRAKTVGGGQQPSTVTLQEAAMVEQMPESLVAALAAIGGVAAAPRCAPLAAAALLLPLPPWP